MSCLHLLREPDLSACHGGRTEQPNPIAGWRRTPHRRGLIRTLARHLRTAAALGALAFCASAAGSTALQAALASAPTTGEVSWGDASAGELGDGTAARSDVPTAVGNLDDIGAVSAGNRFTLALLTDGTVVAWGNNGDGQLGDGTHTSSDVPVPVH